MVQTSFVHPSPPQINISLLREDFEFLQMFYSRRSLGIPSLSSYLKKNRLKARKRDRINVETA